ncbi:MAG: autoinducer binding domain-containing protein [Pseudomonadota bacterium]
MRTDEEFREAVNNCATVEALFAHYRQAMAAEGYENIAFTVLHACGFAELPFLELPRGFAQTYIEQGFQFRDPVLKVAPHRRAPYFWSDLERSPHFCRDERAVIEISREIGVHSGVTVPFQGPEGVVELFSLSQRARNSLDPSRTPIVHARTFEVRRRYWELAEIAAGTAGHAFGDGSFGMRVDPAPWAPIGAHVGGPAGMTSDHCRALVMVEVAARRWEAGLTGMNETLSRHCAEADLDYLLSWGLASEVADDDRWRYYLAPTVLGRKHLACCPDVPRHRRTVLRLALLRGEVPSL